MVPELRKDDNKKQKFIQFTGGELQLEQGGGQFPGMRVLVAAG
jgi:hypothetical protein